MANPQETVTPVTPPPLPPLTFGPKGWRGEGEYFGVGYNAIKIKITDAQRAHIPNVEQRQLTTDEEGNFSVHEQQHSGDYLYQLWMRKIGPYLADWVLGKKPYGATPPWILMQFPENYTLWVHKSGVDTDRGNPRIDTYLYGAPHLGRSRSRSPSQQPLAPTIFRSPMEFVEHAIWLMKGCVDQCKCKYCMPGQNQKEINLRLNRGVDLGEDEPESDGGGGSAGTATGTRNASSSSSSRPRRGAGGGTRGSRRGKRDRSPPIMAKDYRVGFPGTT